MYLILFFLYFQEGISKFVMLYVLFSLLKAIILMMNLYVWDENMHISFIKYSIKIGLRSSVTHSKMRWWIYVDLHKYLDLDACWQAIN